MEAIKKTKSYKTISSPMASGDIDFYLNIVNSRAFQRLKYISFLGAIDYSVSTNLRRLERTRYAHTLNVAALAQHVCRHRNYDKELTRHLITAALLHDIGHSPLSHSMENKFISRWGRGHHEQGREIISGDNSLGKDLNNLLKKEVDLAFIHAILDGTASGDGCDLFSNNINIDTIDGIIRASKYTNFPSRLCPFEVAECSFVSESTSRNLILDEFWKLKNFIYNSLIQGHDGLRADFISQQYFEISNLQESDLLTDELAWKTEHSLLFDMLDHLSNNRHASSCVDNQELLYTKKTYHISPNSPENRYIFKKESATYKFIENLISIDCCYA